MPAVVPTAKRTAVRFFPVRLAIALRGASGITLYSAGSIMEYLVFLGTVKSDLKCMDIPRKGLLKVYVPSRVNMIQN